MRSIYKCILVSLVSVVSVVSVVVSLPAKAQQTVIQTYVDSADVRLRTERFNNPTARGFHFVPQKDGYISSVAGLFDGEAQVKLFARADGELLSEATVNGNNANFVSTDIEPVQVLAGTEYTIAAYLNANGQTRQGALYRVKNVADVYPFTVEDVQVIGGAAVGTKNNPDRVPTPIRIHRRIDGVVDFTFSEQLPGSCGEICRITTQIFAGNYPGGLSDNGNFVVFTTSIAYDDSDTNNKADVYLMDLNSGNKERVSISTEGLQSDEHVFAIRPDVSDDGDVVFTSGLNVHSDFSSIGVNSLFLRNKESRTIEKILEFPDKGILYPQITPDGRFISFISYYIDSNNSGIYDVWRYDRETNDYEKLNTGQDIERCLGIDYEMSINGQIVAHCRVGLGDSNHLKVYYIDPETGGDSILIDAFPFSSFPSLEIGGENAQYIGVNGLIYDRINGTTIDINRKIVGFSGDGNKVYYTSCEFGIGYYNMLNNQYQNIYPGGMANSCNKIRVQNTADNSILLYSSRVDIFDDNMPAGLFVKRVP